MSVEGTLEGGKMPRCPNGHRRVGTKCVKTGSPKKASPKKASPSKSRTAPHIAEIQSDIDALVVEYSLTPAMKKKLEKYRTHYDGLCVLDDAFDTNNKPLLKKKPTMAAFSKALNEAVLSCRRKYFEHDGKKFFY